MSCEAMKRLLMDYAKIIDDKNAIIEQQKRTIDILTKVLWECVPAVDSAECPHDI